MTKRIQRAIQRGLCATAAAAALFTAAVQPARAHNNAAPALVLSAGATLSVVAVEASAEGTVWVLERASDGARASIKLAGHSATAVGTGVVVTAMSAGWLLSAAGQAIAFIPNEIGKSLLYNERVTR
jgi:hypothetical protein